jgi:hypothetical protein
MRRRASASPPPPPSAAGAAAARSLTLSPWAEASSRAGPHSCPSQAACSASAFLPATSSCSTTTAVCCSSLSLGPCCSTLWLRPGWLVLGARMRATSASTPPPPSSLGAAPCRAEGAAGQLSAEAEEGASGSGSSSSAGCDVRSGQVGRGAAHTSCPLLSSPTHPHPHPPTPPALPPPLPPPPPTQARTPTPTCGERSCPWLRAMVRSRSHSTWAASWCGSSALHRSARSPSHLSTRSARTPLPSSGPGNVTSARCSGPSEAAAGSGSRPSRAAATSSGSSARGPAISAGGAMAAWRSSNAVVGRGCTSTTLPPKPKQTRATEGRPLGLFVASTMQRGAVWVSRGAGG